MKGRWSFAIFGLACAAVLVGCASFALGGASHAAPTPTIAATNPRPAAAPGSPAPTDSRPTPAASARPTPRSPSPAPTATPAASVEPSLDPPAVPGPFAMDLYGRGDFVTEKTPIWCAPAAMQTMINIMSPGADTTRATQKLLHTISRKLGPAPDKGTEPEGMVRTLESLGYGRFEVAVARTRAAAFKVAARAIRLTGRPVALLVWRGAHNWVVSGFRSTADPALGDSFRVTHLLIEDVWYPRISNIWGASRPPDTLVPVRLMPEDYLPWKRPTGRYPGKDGRFILIVPVPTT